MPCSAVRTQARLTEEARPVRLPRKPLDPVATAALDLPAQEVPAILTIFQPSRKTRTCVVSAALIPALPVRASLGSQLTACRAESSDIVGQRSATHSEKTCTRGKRGVELWRPRQTGVLQMSPAAPHWPSDARPVQGDAPPTPLSSQARGFSLEGAWAGGKNPQGAFLLVAY